MEEVIKIHDSDWTYQPILVCKLLVAHFGDSSSANMAALRNPTKFLRISSAILCPKVSINYIVSTFVFTLNIYKLISKLIGKGATFICVFFGQPAFGPRDRPRSPLG